MQNTDRIHNVWNNNISFVMNRQVFENGGENPTETEKTTPPPPEQSQEFSPTSAKQVGEDAKAAAAHLVDAKTPQSEELASASELLKKKGLTEDEAAKLYDAMITPAANTIKFFSQKEANYDRNRIPLGEAWKALGGDPARLDVSGEKVKPSNALEDGLETDPTASTSKMSAVWEALNAMNSNDHVAALVELSKDITWKQFSKGLATLDDRSKKARAAFDAKAKG